MKHVPSISLLQGAKVQSDDTIGDLIESLPKCSKLLHKAPDFTSQN